MIMIIRSFQIVYLNQREGCPFDGDKKDFRCQSPSVPRSLKSKRVNYACLLEKTLVHYVWSGIK